MPRKKGLGRREHPPTRRKPPLKPRKQPLVVLTEQDIDRISPVSATHGLAEAVGVDTLTADLIRQEIDACVDIDESSPEFRKMYKDERSEHPSFSDDQILQIVRDHFRMKEVGLTGPTPNQQWVVWIRRDDYLKNRRDIRPIILNAEREYGTTVTVDLRTSKITSTITGDNYRAMKQIHNELKKMRLDVFITPFGVNFDIDRQISAKRPRRKRKKKKK